jgi:D-alanyl-D-alanine dipeptidase
MKVNIKLSTVIFFVIIVLFTGCAEKDSASKSTPNTGDSPIIAMDNGSESQPISSQPSESSIISAVPEIPENNIKTPEVTEQEPEEPPLKIQGLVNILDIDNTIVVDLKYATADNFTGQVIYDFTTCLLREETALKLKAANEELSKSSYRIKIFDGYRPPYAQKVLWKAVPNPTYVANPNKGGSIHSRGAAVDITIVDSEGNDLEMPTEYDDLSPAAAPSSKAMSETARKNMLTLQKAMTNNGFRTITSEWWHFNDTDSSKYSIIEVDPKKFNGSQQ